MLDRLRVSLAPECTLPLTASFLIVFLVLKHVLIISTTMQTGIGASNAENLPNEEKTCSDGESQVEKSHHKAAQPEQQMEKLEAHKDSTDQKAKSPVVDHGLLCWLQVLGAFGMWTNVSRTRQKDTGYDH